MKSKCFMEGVVRAAITLFFLCYGTVGLTDTSLTPAQTRNVLSEGKVLSSAMLSLGVNGPDELGFAAAAPTGTRIHEVFVYYNAEIYLCSKRPVWPL
jgi:hypothetical protein